MQILVVYHLITLNLSCTTENEISTEKLLKSELKRGWTQSFTYPLHIYICV